MHHSLASLSTMIIFIVIFTSSFAQAAKLKVLADFYKESETLQELTQKETSKDKSQHLKKLEKSFKSALDQYEKESPKEGNSEEQRISLLFYTLEPVFKLAQKNSFKESSCNSTRQEIKTGDSMGRPQGHPASKQATEAYKWLDLLCSEKK